MTEIRVDPLTGLRAIIADHPLLSADSPDPPPREDPSLFTALAARGAHELIANGPARTLAELSVEQACAALDTWRERMLEHDGAAYVHVGVDELAVAQEDSQAELLAFGFVPVEVARERERFSAHAVRTMGANLLEDLVGEEVRRRERIVAIDDEAVLMCPYASRHPFALMLAPRRRRDRFQDDGATGAALLHKGLTLLRARFGSGPPLSLWVRSAPRGAERFCWHIDVVPRLSEVAGLQLGTGLAHNPVAPEQAAAELRALL
ncbi:MAG: UDPglucose--hexose-phosphate uridylyltransferase [Solirubrobacteraceae bacterium]|jgi:UDPglucose--hexose-1-phosphate uridylyltransferase|nr:UDPglucose--hexose-phosphate uridylyltransferase [Solirubrobacteraceae bacterium]